MSWGRYRGGRQNGSPDRRAELSSGGSREARVGEAPAGRESLEGGQKTLSRGKIGWAVRLGAPQGRLRGPGAMGDLGGGRQPGRGAQEPFDQAGRARTALGGSHSQCAGDEG